MVSSADHHWAGVRPESGLREVDVLIVIGVDMRQPYQSSIPAN